MKEKLVMIGNGMAGMRTIEELLKIAPDMYDITVFGDEPYGNYNRILLSPVLAGDKTIDEIMLNTIEWYEENNIKLHAGKRVSEINRISRTVTAEDGTTEEYDRLLIATGSRPFIIPVPGHDKEGVIAFRDIKDVDTMLDATRNYQHATVIGGGLLGLEAANGMMQHGMKVTVVHLCDTLMERQMDTVSGKMLKNSLEEKGMDFRMEAQTAEISGNGRVTGVKFADGSSIDTDLVVMAVGIRPNMELAQKSGLHCDRGVVVNDTMQTYDPRIYSVGECVQHRGNTYGLVAPLFEMAKVCANHLAQMGIGLYEGSVTSTKLKVTGIDLFSAGDFTGDETTEEMVMQDATSGLYKKLVLKDNRLIGAVLYGDTKEGAWYFQLMRSGQDISDIRDKLLFGESHLGDSGHGGDHIALMADDAEVCGCNGVCKGDIVKAITTEGLFSLDEIRAHTKASASCGSCTGLVEQLLESTLGSDYETPECKPLCKCTDHSHEAVREAIREKTLTSIKDVRRALNWKTVDGCPTCRMALNYYVQSSWHNEAQDDPQSRFINERAHANIQKNGSYSVIPRMWGGMTTPDELRAIAHVAEKYEIKDVHLTGGQRIALYGVEKEVLPKIWKDLNDAGMVSGHAYGKAMRTVKTCVGKQWCRFGTQDSTSLGIKLEELTWASWMPHKFKLAVSGCPRNCAEATIKDFGVVCVDSGYELHIGGNGGIKVRATDFLCNVTTVEEVMEYCGAFIQFYREDAHYLERTAPWVERVGFSRIEDTIVKDEVKRKYYNKRFLEAQKIAQVDPWQARATGGVAAHEFASIKVVNA
ncbi:MAG: nitrite reductase large subunit NirB [Gammaproteobacteria bacterium]|nr:nitrite reductase large subunit NirB [Gammaproteobacteria bacterium]